MELQRKYGLGDHWRPSPLSSFLKPYLRDGNRIREHPWDLMNFRLPNRDLARIWRLGHEVVGWGRYLHRRPLAWWRFKPGSGGIHFIMREQLEAYQRAVKVEEQHAARCFAQASGCGAGGKTP